MAKAIANRLLSKTAQPILIFMDVILFSVGVYYLTRDSKRFLEWRRRMLEAARNGQAAGQPEISIQSRLSDRVKKMWNEDMRQTVQRMKNTEWERMGRVVGGRMIQAKQRMAGSIERMRDSSKKESS
jgi:hypothetical protein